MAAANGKHFDNEATPVGMLSRDADYPPVDICRLEGSVLRYIMAGNDKLRCVQAQANSEEGGNQLQVADR